jgi:hypothetical protein
MVGYSAMKNELTFWLRSLAVTTWLIAPAAHAQTAKASDATTGSAPANQSTTDTPPTKEQCIDSHRQSQQSQNEGKLVHARELARTCTSLACPGLLISDCARWLTDLDQRIPSAVFEVRVDGQPNRDAQVFADGKLITEWTRGEAIRLDPGEHQFRFELANHEPITQNLLLAEGMRYRVITVEFKTPVAATATGALTPAAPVAPAPSAAKERPTPFIVYPLLGVGVLGAAGFGTFAFLGSKKEKDLDTSCSPNCTDSELKPMKSNYLIGDIALGIGAASLVTAGIVYFTRPEKDAPTVGFTPLPGGAAGFASYRF